MPNTQSAAEKSLLNRIFHHIDRGSTTGREISAGILICILSVCGIFMNMQLIGQATITSYYGANASTIAASGEQYAQMYLISMLLSFAGSLLIGLIAGLPLVQVSGLGLSTVVISLMGTGSGLTYYNLLFITFVSSLIYAVIALIPAVRKALLDAVPAPVRKALPAAVGLLLAYTAMQLSGIITVTSSGITAFGSGSILSDASSNVMLSGLIRFNEYSYSTDKYYPLLQIGCIAALAAIVFYFIFRRRTRKPYLFSLLGGTVVYWIGSILFVNVNWKNMKFSLDSLYGRAFMVGGEDAMQLHVSASLSHLSIGKIFSQGTDFSAFTENGGNVILLFAVGLIVMLLVMLMDAQASIDAVQNRMLLEGEERESGAGRALICSSLINVAAPLFGAAPLSIGKTSFAGVEDGGRSGLASVTAALGFLICAFVWIIPGIFATYVSYSVTFNLYGHYGTCLELLTECGFAVADVIMAMAGLSMAVRCFTQDWTKLAERTPFIATVAGTFFLSNLAYGAAVGILVWLLCQIPQAGKENAGRPAVSPVTWILGALSLLILAAAFFL